jgi:hypothetical protein
MATLNRAIEIASKAHEGATDKYGAPYINHVTRVMNMGQNDNEKIVGVLHDVIEDTHWTFEDLEKEGFSKEVIDAIKCVTKTSEDEDYEEFINRVKINPLAVKIKLNDLRDNLDIKRMSEVLESDLKRLNKYLRAYNELRTYYTVVINKNYTNKTQKELFEAKWEDLNLMEKVLRSELESNPNMSWEKAIELFEMVPL